MLKVEDREKAISEYVEEIVKRFPGAKPRIMNEKMLSTEDVWIRIEGVHPRSLNRVLDAAAELQQKWYLERGIYIFVTVSGTGPV